MGIVKAALSDLSRLQHDVLASVRFLGGTYRVPYVTWDLLDDADHRRGGDTDVSWLNPCLYGLLLANGSLWAHYTYTLGERPGIYAEYSINMTLDALFNRNRNKEQNQVCGEMENPISRL